MLCKVFAIMPCSNYQQRNQKRLDGEKHVAEKVEFISIFLMWKSLRRCLDMFTNDSLKYLPRSSKCLLCFGL